MKIFLLLFIALSFSVYASEDEFQLVTGELLPLSYKQNEELKGISIDIVKELIKRTKYKGDIKFKPWARVIKESESDIVLSFPLARIPYREEKYKWIGPILEDEFVFVSKKSNLVSVNDMNDLKTMKIGVAIDAPTEKRLKDKSFSNLIIAQGESQLANMFINNRFDVWYSSDIFIKSFLKQYNYDVSLIEIVYKDLNIEFYIAASLRVDDLVIENWQNELKKMKEDGSYRDILISYGIER